MARFPGNPRTHRLDVLRSSLAAHGQYRPIVANRRTGQVLAGNGTHEAAELEGWEQIAVTWVDVDDDTARRIVAVDNRASDLGGYDEQLLADLLSSLPGLDGTGYDQTALDELLARVQAATVQVVTDPDDIPEPPAEPVCKPGDLWVVGQHRLLCGDSRDPDQVARLMHGERAHWHTRPGEACYEPFAGSGSQLVAAHGLGRRCYAIEIAPRYCDVALRRFQQHTGIVPVLEQTGEPHDFTQDTQDTRQGAA